MADDIIESYIKMFLVSYHTFEDTMGFPKDLNYVLQNPNNKNAIFNMQNQ